jgi:class 3 adenylate cyclase
MSSASRVVDCAAPRDAVWRILADTNRMNQAMGLSPLSLEPIDDGGGARFLVKARLGGFEFEYEELPFEWVEKERQTVKRRVRRGPVKEILLDMRLADRQEGGTKVTFELTLTPRSVLWSPFMPMMGRRFLATYAEVVEKLDGKDLVDPWAGAAERIPVTRSHEATGVLARAGAALREAVDDERKPLAERLVGFVATAPDLDVSRIRPFELADAWEEPRRAVLAMCLDAVTAGLLELTWDVVCPSCRVGAETVTALEDVSTHGACQLCDLEFAVDFDGTVEATFRPIAAVRAIDIAPFCVGGAARTPHVFAQTMIAPRGEALLPAPKELGPWRLFARGGDTISVSVAADGPAEAAVGLESKQAITVGPGGVIHLSQTGEEERHVKLERTVWRNQAATAQDVALLPAFRERFSSEVLRTGLALRVTRSAILFSDLAGSTALYTHAGDAVAFRVVSEHFALLSTIVAAHEGAIVKTIGDAVMAVFSDEAAAVRAAAAMLAAYVSFRRTNPDAASTDLKIGLFAGPCYAVTANAQLDYFGQTVNLAARLLGLAKAGEVVVPEEVHKQALPEGWEGPLVVGEELSVVLKGFVEPTRAVRLRRPS